MIVPSTPLLLPLVGAGVLDVVPVGEGDDDEADGVEDGAELVGGVVCLDRVSGLTQQRPAVPVQPRSELIVGRRQRRGIARNDRRHQVPVTHAINAMASREVSD